MDNFWTALLTLFGVGLVISFAKSMKMKHKPKWGEAIADGIISGASSVSAACVYLIVPTAPLIAVVGLGALLATLGMIFISDKLTDVVNAYIKKRIE